MRDSDHHRGDDTVADVGVGMSGIVYSELSSFNNTEGLLNTQLGDLLLFFQYFYFHNSSFSERKNATSLLVSAFLGRNGVKGSSCSKEQDEV